MGVKAKAKLRADAAILSLQVKKENLFLGVPPKFKIIKVASLTVVNPIINSIKQQILGLLGSLSLEMLLSLGLGFLFAQLNKNNNSNNSNNSNIPNSVISDINISDQDLLDAVKTNKDLSAINKFISKDFDKKMADELTEACANEDFDNDIIKLLEKSLLNKDFNADDFINIVKSNSDFENSTEELDLTEINTKNNPENALRNLLDKFGSVLAILLLLFSVFMLVREYITSNRYPSQFRGRILGNIIRTITSLIKKLLKPIPSVSIPEKPEIPEKPNSPKKPKIKEIKEQQKNTIKSLISSLNIIDAVVIALSAVTLIYLNNRKKGQQIAFDELSVIASAENCNILPTAREITDESNNGVLQNIETIPFSYDSFPCPIDVTNIPIVPHTPFEEKVLDNFCDVDTDLLNENINDIINNNTAGDAIFENLSDLSFTKTVFKDHIIYPGQSIGTIGKDTIYAPVGGKIIKIENNKIWLTDIVDGGFEPIHIESEILKSKFVETTDIKEFIREFYGIVQYPSIVSKAKDPELSITVTTINDSAPIVLYNELIDNITIIKETYETNIKTIAGEDNVRIQSEAENLLGLQKSIDIEENLLFKNLKESVESTNTKALEINAIDGNYILMDWYFRLLSDLQNFYNPNNIIIIDFQRKLNELLLERFFVENHNIEEIELLIDELLNYLDFSVTINKHISKLNNIWNRNIGKDSVKSIKLYIENVGKQNVNISRTKKEKLVNRITSLYIFIKDAQNILKQTTEYIPNEDSIERASKEKIFIDNYFASLFKKINTLNVDIEKSTKKLGDMGSSAVPPAIRTIDDIDYEWYGLKGRERSCPIPSVEDPNLSPYTSDDYNQYRYWLKYCAIATLFSIVPSIIGRAKGFPTPPPGVPFPVIYIPFFGMITKWGIFAVGLTITGIFPFPWLLFTNFSSDYNTPLGDPTAPVKNTIRKTKKDLSKKLKNHNQKTLNGYLNKSNNDIDVENKKLANTESQKQIHKANRPIRVRSNNKNENIKNKAIYNKDLVEWKRDQLAYSADISIQRKSRYELERKNKVVKNAQNGDSTALSKASDTKLVAIKTSEDSLNIALDKLDILIDSTDLILAPLPITMKPDTCNFGFTPKNKKIILEIDEDIDKQIQQPAVNSVLSKFEMKSDDFISTGYSKTANKLLNRGLMQNALKIAMPLMLTNDPFPKYENLSPLNLSWIPFLIKNWGPSGAKSFGIPI